MNERLYQLTTPIHLNGILSLPRHRDPTKPALIILNSGLVHRVGACRMSVKFARKIADLGFLVLRFDLSNLGDSPARHDYQGDDDSRTCEEIQLMMDRLETDFGVKRFVFYGLCSGAQNSFKAAVGDSRIEGIFGIDNFGFRTKAFPLHYYGRKFLTITPWLNILKKILKPFVRVFGQSSETVSDNQGSIADSDFEWMYPAQETVEAGYKVLMQRGVRCYYIYTGDWQHEYCYRNQFFDMFPNVHFKDQVTVIYEPKMSHILSEPTSQRFVEKKLVKFLQSFC